MRVLGLDQSLRRSGLVILGDGGKLISAETYQSKERDLPRLQEIRRAIETTCGLSGVTHIVMEGLSFGSVGKVTELAGLYWLIRDLFCRIHRPVLTVAPTTLKKWVTGSGRAEKNEIMRCAYKKWGIELDEHQTDAYGLANLGHKFYGTPKKVLAYEQEVLLMLKEKLLP